jgi:hypothetical protein
MADLRLWDNFLNLAITDPKQTIKEKPPEGGFGVYLLPRWN